MEKRPEKIILWHWRHLRLDIAVRKEKSRCRHTGDDADAVVIALIFNRATMEKTIPPRSLAIAGEEGEINFQKQETLVWRDSNPKGLIY